MFCASICGMEQSNRRMVAVRAVSAPMTAPEFRAALERFSYSQEGLALALGYSARAGQRWALGEARVPGAVAVVLRLLMARPELAAVLAQIAPMPLASRQRRGRQRPRAVDERREEIER